MSFGETRPSEVVAVAGEYFGVSPAEILGPGRTSNVTAARLVAMTVTRRMTGRSYPEIAKAFGRDHTTIVSATQRVAKVERLSRAADAVIARLDDGPTVHGLSHTFGGCELLPGTRDSVSFDHDCHTPWS